MTTMNGADSGGNDWPLVIKIPDLSSIKEVRVYGSLHIGGCILKLINLLNIQTDWSDFALWWPAKKLWLLKTKQTLDQYGLQANDELHFTHIHKPIRVELPDLQQIELKLNFSISLFQLIQTVCKNLGIKHYEELSMLRARQSQQQDNNGENSVYSTLTKNGTLNKVALNANDNGSNASSSADGKSLDKLSFEYDPQQLAMSPVQVNIQDKLKSFTRYKSLFDKCRINSHWLDSSKSLMEQDINESDLVKLRFKYFAFYDLNVKFDLIRINQIFEQAKWSILSEEIDCTDEELIAFAALLLQVQIHTKQALNANPVSPYRQTNRSNSIDNEIPVKRVQENEDDDDDDVDAALSKLEKSLQDQSLSEKPAAVSNKLQTVSASIMDLTQSAELCEELFLMKHKYTFKKFKTYFFVLRDTYLSYYKTKADYFELKTKPIEKYCLKNCEIMPDLNVLASKYGIFLKIFNSSEVVDLYLRCFNDESYAKWLAAIKLAARNKTINDADAYKFEIDAVKNLVEMQKAKKSSLSTSSATMQSQGPILDDFQVQNFVPQGLLKKFKTKQLTDRIIETHSNLSDLSLIDAKLRYIKTWQALPDYGISYFCVRFKGSKNKEEILGVSSTRLLRYSYDCKLTKQWRLNAIKTWYVNWDIKQFDVEFEDEKLQFLCLTSLNPKILNEYIGAYIFLSLRTAANEQNLDHDLFYKLTDKH